MSDLQRALRRSLGAIAGVLAFSCALTPVANAGTYGEITHFGSKGVAEGQFEGSLASTAIGVDPRDNSVYVVDVPGGKAEEKNEFRLQKFKANKEGKYEVVASVRFKPAVDEKEETDTVEGVAVDPSTNRVYLLAAEERNPEKVGEVDPQVSAATQIYAFSTIESGKALVPASGTGEGKEVGVLAGAKVLNPLSKTRGVSLLEPSGIAVDPTTGDVIIVAEEDFGSSEGNRIVLQRVNKKGELGARWIDETGFFEDEASSPAVTATGKVLVQGFEQIDEVPANFAGEEAPTVFGHAALEAGVETLTTIPGSPEPSSGGALSIGEDGTIYVRAGIADQYVPEPFKYPGIDEFTSAGAEKGWTGGQSVASVGEGGPCKIGFSAAPQIAAGKSGDVFVYNVNRELAVPVDQILEFGPGGGGCPVGKATAPIAKVNGTPVSESEAIPISKNVTLSSTLTESNALEVTWEFGDGTSETIKTDEYQKTEVTHRFKAAGTLTVTEKIKTDALEAPLLVVTSHVKVESDGPGVLTEAAKPVGSTTATLNATVNPKGVAVTECVFEYGPTSITEKTAPCSKLPGSGTTAEAVSAAVVGLTAHTTYKFVIFAKNATENGESAGTVLSFTTGPPPVAVTGTATAVTQSTATFNGTVNPEGGAVESCFFEYGSSSFNHEASCATLPGSGTSAVAVTAAVTGLTAGTTYKFRLVAKEAGSLSGSGSEVDFKTEAPPVETKTTTTTTPTTESKPPPVVVRDASPLVKVALSSATASSSGAFTLKVSCPAGAGTCTGTLTLKTAKAVVASVGHAAKSKASILTLGSVSFTVTAGQSKSVTVHLSTKARKLLAKLKKILAKATVVARNGEGVSATTVTTLTLKAAKPKAHH